MGEIPSGSVLYRVHASTWGDTRLFFRHQDMADDLRLKPDWNRHTPNFELGADRLTSAVLAPISTLFNFQSEFQ